jgi:uncharacterized protein involved in outer membrane biogenesis
MQKGLIGGASVLVALAVIVLIAPSFIDWNGYRGLLAAQLSSALGREVTITGDMDAALLPRPAFKAANINIGGGGAVDFISIEQLYAHLAFVPLLTGQLQLRALVLLHPEVRFTQGGDDTAGSLFCALRPCSVAPVHAEDEAENSPFDLAVERVEIENGTFTVRDAASRATWRSTGIEAQVAIAARGHITASGTLTVEGTPLAVNGTLTPVDAANADGINLTVRVVEADVTAKFIGSVSRTPDHDFRGDVSVTGGSSRALLAIAALVGPQTPLPAALLQPFSLAAKVSGTTSSVATDGLTMDIGGTGANGIVVWTGGEVPHLNVDLDFAAVDIDAWKFASVAASSHCSKFAALREIFACAYEADAPGENFKSPRSITATVNIRAPLLSYGDDVLRDGALNVSLSDGTLAVREIGVTVPGATRIRAFGFLQEGGPIPVFDGVLEVETRNLREALTWLGVGEKLEQVPRGRLSYASLRTAVQGTLARLSFGDITAEVDTVSATGAAFVVREDRVSFGVDLTINALNLDTYVPVMIDEGWRALFSGVSEDAAGSPDVYGLISVFDSLQNLADVDAEVRVTVNALTAGSVPDGRVGLDLSLTDGVLNIRSASFDNVAGATIWFSGGLGGFGITPQFQDFQFDLHTEDIGRFGRAFGVNVPLSMRSLAPVTLTGVLSGGVAQADLIATVKVGDVTVYGNGQGLSLDQQPQLTLSFNANHPSYARLVAALTPTWPAGATDPGAVSLTARITQTNTSTMIEDLNLSIGEEHVVGRIAVNETAGRKQVSATFSEIAVAFDQLWPNDPTLQFSAPARASSSSQAPAPNSSIWSDTPVDWSFLADWDGEVSLSGSRLNVRGVDLRDFDCTITIADGAAEISAWSGYLFGARGQLSLQAIAAPDPSLQGEISFSGGDFASVAKAINGGGSTGLKPGVGDVDFAGQFVALGSSPRSLIESLSGSGTLKITTTSAGTGVVAGLLGAVSAATQVESIVPRGRNTPVTVAAKLSAEKGRIEIVEGTVKSRSYGGAFTGTIDLPKWLVDVSGRLRLENLPRADAATQRTLPTSVPITVRGRLDLLNIILEPS